MTEQSDRKLIGTGVVGTVIAAQLVTLIEVVEAHMPQIEAAAPHTESPTPNSEARMRPMAIHIEWVFSEE